MMRIACTILLFHCLTAFGQIPETLVSERSIVILDLPYEKQGEYLVRGNWKQEAQKIQKNLSLMGVDAVGYLHVDDWNASNQSKETYQLFFAQRTVKHAIYIKRNQDQLYELIVCPLTKYEAQWRTEAGSISQALLRLGQEIKKSDHMIENFLSTGNAEIFVDIPFSKYSASTMYPDQIKRLKVGVAKFPDDAKNQKLATILESYPFQFELFDYKDDDDAFRKGYQYVLINMSTSGESIKKLLNYRIGQNETDYISTVKGDSSNTVLKTIPVDALVYKFYLKHTVNHEVFVGKDWDADTSWEAALENFILNLRVAFRRI